MTWRLALFGLISSLVVGLVYVWTAPMIQTARENARLDALFALAAPLLEDGDLGQPTEIRWPDAPPESLGPSSFVTPIVKDEQWLGMVLPVQTNDGYSGPIKLLMAIDRSGRIVGLRAIEHRETPGLGDRIEVRKSDWMLGFNGLRYTDLAPADWAVRPDGGQFDSFTGATITPRAVVTAVASALSYLEQQNPTMEWAP